MVSKQKVTRDVLFAIAQDLINEEVLPTQDKVGFQEGNALQKFKCFIF